MPKDSDNCAEAPVEPLDMSTLPDKMRLKVVETLINVPDGYRYIDCDSLETALNSNGARRLIQRLVNNNPEFCSSIPGRYHKPEFMRDLIVSVDYNKVTKVLPEALKLLKTVKLQQNLFLIAIRRLYGKDLDRALKIAGRELLTPEVLAHHAFKYGKPSVKTLTAIFGDDTQNIIHQVLDKPGFKYVHNVPKSFIRGRTTR